MAVALDAIMRVLRRPAGGAAGAPSTLKSGAMAYNETEDVLYIGVGDNGSGVATSIKVLAGLGKFATSDDINSLFIGSNTAPTSPVPGQRWLKTDTGIEYTWFADGDSGQWVQL